MRIIKIVSLIIAVMAIAHPQSWHQLGNVIYGNKTNQLFGYAVALSANGNSLTIGGSQANSSDGLARVYSFKDTKWEQIGVDIPNNESAIISTLPITELSIDSTVAIGSPMHDANGENSGRTKFYLYTNGKWTSVNCDIDGESDGDLWGSAGAFARNAPIVAIGAPYNDGNGINSGHVRVYTFVNDSWIQIGQDIDGELGDDLFGSAISISSDGLTVAIGAPNNDGNGDNSGHVRVYSFANDSWVQIGQDIDGHNNHDRFGQSISLSSDGYTIAIGAPLSDKHGEDSGQVRIFKYDGYLWNQQGNTLNGKYSGDNFGQSISLSSSGKIIAVGAPLNDDNGINSGAVILYGYNGTNWNNMGSDINGNAGDNLGQSVSISSDGLRIAVGAPYSNKSGVNSGYTKVFIYTNNFGKLGNNRGSKTLSVLPAFPNPFNPSTTITYGLNENSDVTIAIYDISGKLITNLLNKEQPQGWHSVDWNGTDMNSNQVTAGIYFSRITSNSTTKTSKLMLLK